ncbi:5-oxoprolinase subunit PxpB [Parapedobacter deserti]|uniref:5-oxoprolinase subunit PxpB n=1 Tax=Parapedobacter deserti TaxID=1912957 RepID=A0ABV7JT38_9SPHI
MKYLPLNEYAVTVYFGELPDEETRSEIARLDAALQARPFPGLVEAVPAYVSLTVYYDALQVNRQQVIRFLEELSQTAENTEAPEGMTVNIPVCYGGQYGPDLSFVADHNALSEAEIIDIHSSATYRVHMIGFMPGFPYLGGMSPRIAAPRMATPRPQVLAGSVGIAGEQTGVYPFTSPGGWQLIGRTPFRLFDIRRPSPSLLTAGQLVRFCPIDTETFEDQVRIADHAD